VKYEEPALLLRNDGSGIFHDMREHAGTAFRGAYVARGLGLEISITMGTWMWFSPD
jgi:hypothetical protein